MGKILDFIVGNTFVFIAVLGLLLILLGLVILSITKSGKKHKIPIYEEIDENIELENAKEEDIIEKPIKASKKSEEKIEVSSKKKNAEDKIDKKEKKNTKSKKEVIVIMPDDEKEEITEEVEALEEKEIKEEPKKETTKKKKSSKKKEEIKEEKIEEEAKEEVVTKEDKIKEELESIFNDTTEKFEEDVAFEETEEIDEVEPDEFVLEEFDDEALREELEQIDDKEIEERIDEEHKKDIEEVIKENDNEELQEILVGMKDTNTVDPEEVVRTFEEEQEAQSIISYQELLDVVKKRDNDFEDELESRPLTTVSDFIKNNQTLDVETETEVLEMIEKLDKPNKELANKENFDKIEALENEVEALEVLSEEEVEEPKEEQLEEKEPVSEIPEEGRFKRTDVISPVFGRIQQDVEIDYPKVEKFDRRPKKEIVVPEERKTNNLKSSLDIEKEMRSVSAMFEDISTKVEEKERREDKIADKTDLEEDEIENLSAISKNEDFLKALKDFRDSL